MPSSPSISNKSAALSYYITASGNATISDAVTQQLQTHVH